MDIKIQRFSGLYYFLIIIVLLSPIALLNTQPLNKINGDVSFISDSSLNGMHWRLVGPFRGGRALAASGIPGNPATFYFGSVDGGIWKTINAGVTWEPISDGQMNPSIGTLAISESNPNIIYAGTGEADMRSDITFGDGVYKSIDGGVHWKHIGLKDTKQIGKIIVDPQNPDIVLVAALGHPYGFNNERGVFKSTDGGKTWKKVLYKNDKTGAIDLAWDSKDPNVVYAAMWEAKRTPWSQYPPEEGPGSGLYKSTDEGNSWVEIKNNGLPDDTLGRIGISVVEGSHGEKVYALIEALHKGSGLYYSNNGGNSWQLMSNNIQITTRMWYFCQISVDPKNPKIIYAPNRSLFRSEDGGKTFIAVKGEPGGDDYHYVWIDPENDNHLITASDQGTVISLDNGQTWSSWYNQPTAQFYHVATDNQFPYRLYGAQQDAGTVSIASRSDYGVITFRDWYPVNAGESGYIVPDPVNPNIVYGGDTYGGLFRFERMTGQTQNISPWLLSSFGQPISEQKYRFTWTSPIGFDYNNPASLYFGAQVLLKTQDGGLNWEEVSPDLTGMENPKQNTSSTLTIDNAASKGMGVIYSFAFSKINTGVIWVGTDDGFIQLSKDGGKNWENVTPAELKPWSKIGIIEASHFNANVCYTAVDRHRLDDYSPYIYKTDDFGKHWKRIDSGLPLDAYVNVIREDPVAYDLLYAGTEKGVYVSFNGGENWYPLQINLSQVSVRDLKIHDNDLIAATHGRSFWILDDVSSLRQISTKSLNSDVYLFKPEDASRIRRTESHDTPLPPEFPHGENPPSGAIIDYYLKSNNEGPIELEISDQAGNIIRKYSRDDKFVMPAEMPYFNLDWLPKAKSLTGHGGINRFVWDLRYSNVPSRSIGYGSAVTGEGTVQGPQGPLVLPGIYKVTLIVNGKSYTQPLEVKMDPRVKASKKELSDQLQLALKIWNSSSDQFQLQGILDSLDEKVKTISTVNKADNMIFTETNNLELKIGSLNKSLNEIDLAGLEGTVMSADREPTQPMFQAYNISNNKLNLAIHEWKQIESNEIEKINGLLKKKGLLAIEVPKGNAIHYNFP